MKDVLVLGAGLVSRPIVRYLSGRGGCRITVASLHRADAEAVVERVERARAISLDVLDDGALDAAIADTDIVVSLVPYAFHARVARIAIRHRRPMVTSSYVSPEMRELDAEAQREGVLLLNEVGLDPGIDHMSARIVIDSVHASGGEVVSFSSCCGGLPAPEADTNPWHYKFSWSPRGVLLAGRNPARYRSGGSTVEVPGEELFSQRWPYEVEGHGLFEIYPNRDSLSYVPIYQLDRARDMFRGTIRYRGWCETFRALTELGWLDLEPRQWQPGTTYADLMREMLPGAGHGLVAALSERLSIEPDHPIVARLEWAGLLSDRPIAVTGGSRVDVLCQRMETMMGYAPGERDMILLQHEFVAQWPGERPSERIISRLVAYGQAGGDSAMARTVSLPAAIAARLILDGQLPLTGVHIPVRREIYIPILDELAELGVRFDETRHWVLPSPFDGPPA